MASAHPPKLKKFPATKQRRLDELLDKNSEGSITPVERKRLGQLVAEAEQVMVENAQRLAAFHQQATSSAPVNAVPVTVWVKPAQIEA